MTGAGRRVPRLQTSIGRYPSHKDGREPPLEIAFGEFLRDGRRIFSGYIREARPPAAGS
jgi:hypothetical protein